jgi:hypothetical protein
MRAHNLLRMERGSDRLFWCVEQNGQAYAEKAAGRTRRRPSPQVLRLEPGCGSVRHTGWLRPQR